ncbi:hypothetical protein [Gallaecimonas xiamenensis]|uniref:PilZ domain-containing protein n=1 Tax=Gallaecimonas xiamenensis 3-C-1 TaxID=745411 RepID=K2KCB1_9GAMM|nr:hypothetical protein [Gallaecimonas xiamenensis]EKE74975.1 hypothetical protein B3C1_08806 [Gallaecimonas xiamenensis 3-C-1]
MELRQAARLKGAFLVQIRGLDPLGQPFNLTSLADNIGAGGLYMQLPLPLAVGAYALVAVQLDRRLMMVARSQVLRSEPRAHGLHGLGMGFVKTRLLASRHGRSRKK